MKAVRPILILVIIGGLWFASGYLLYTTWRIFPVFLAYSVFPIIFFAIVPYRREILKLLLISVAIGVVWFGTGYFLDTVLLFPPVMAYAFFPIILIAVLLLEIILFPSVNAGEEDRDGYEED